MCSGCLTPLAWSHIVMWAPDSTMTTVMTLIARLLRQREVVIDDEESRVKQ